VVPLTISEGHFTNTVIPKALGLGGTRQAGISKTHLGEGRAVHYCQPIGTHPSMTDALLARATNIVRAHPALPAPIPESTTLFIAGHGTERDGRSRLAIEHQVEQIRQRRLFAAVHPAFMLESPLIRDCWTLVATRDLIMVPFFISDGLHTAHDIPILLGEPEAAVRDRLARGEPGWINPTCRNGHRLWYTLAIGSEALIADVIIERVEEAARQEPRPTEA
jgi:sirohydrochlorin cobaltochelatase